MSILIHLQDDLVLHLVSLGVNVFYTHLQCSTNPVSVSTILLFPMCLLQFIIYKINSMKGNLNVVVGLIKYVCCELLT